ncbi:HSP90 family protein [Corynebacterium deserti GIMN1.010]|uniref:HSP90 family protein n=1 Tax=Corynebacterium deserti GIMN1.010 TaxID=931089 RepID=A0A0M3Q8V0_9CORY|nr:HSP90 family protein [Corynebacterium deserti]ALC04579.1 HSP90 family protein [Corynebacterium deserti GIMN1.010]
MQDSSRDNFQVDLGGVVDLLSRHIYSGPRVYLRELLQNAVDACTARLEAEDIDETDYQPLIRILPITGDRATFSLVDNGTGLTAEEARELLATVGRTSKRDEFGLQREGRLGQFGIGLLSCFMVADEITMVSRAEGKAAIRWVGHSDGTFSVETLNADASDVIPVGTTVHLTPRPDERSLLQESAVVSIASNYGRYLPIPIIVQGAKNTPITETPVFSHEVEQPKRLETGRARIGRTPFDVIDLSGPGIEGVAYVLPQPQAPHMSRRHSIYVNRMLVSDGPSTVLPNWAFFVECEINSTDLEPTASREALMDDTAFAATRDFIGERIKAWLLNLAMTKPHRVREFTTIHDLALRELCLSDEDLAETMLGLLTLETSRGRITIGEITTLSLTEDISLQLATSLDDFRQLTSIARPEVLIINGGYVHDSELARLIPVHFPPLNITTADLRESMDVMELPPLEDIDKARALDAEVTEALKDFNIHGATRVFEPADVPAVVIIDSRAQAARDRYETKGSTTDRWADILATVDSSLSRASKSTSSDHGLSALCLNWNNGLVRQLAATNDQAVVSRTVRLLYVQALLASKKPLQTKERVLLNDSLADLVSLSLSTDI